MSQQPTPLMAQYLSIKALFPDALLFFQVGDFYELFFDDAITAAQFLAITLTKRGKHHGVDIPLCGVPVHTVSHYLVKLVKGGFTVALCDQVSKPQPGTVVERAVTKVYSPGTLTELDMLDAKTASYLCVIGRDAITLACSVVFIEVLTAHMSATLIPDGDRRVLETELARYMPDEIVIEPAHMQSIGGLMRKWGYTVTTCERDDAGAYEWCRTFSSLTVNNPAVVRDALALVYSFLHTAHAAILAQLRHVAWYEADGYVGIDAATQRNLALLKNSDGAFEHSVCWAVDATETVMGARLLKKWLVRPLKNLEKIVQRLDVVSLFTTDATRCMAIKECLKRCADLERVVGRCALGRAVLNDYLLLRDTLALLPSLVDQLVEVSEHNSLLASLVDTMMMYGKLHALLSKALDNGDGIIAAGYCSVLDNLRALARDGQAHMQSYAAAEAQKHDIATLKVLYTGVSGYFLEVTKTHQHKVPEFYEHVQTLSNRARYTTPALRELERALTTADTDAQEREQLLFQEIKDHVATWVGALRRTASSLATLDVLTGFAHRALSHQYVRPQFHENHGVMIRDGRHCVVEQVADDGAFIANDTVMADTDYVWMITGPNMGGKSTYLRQVALIHILAQCGSFVPARSATLPLVDRIFTRIGAGDNVAQGKSTFLVEMEETATICMQATSRSVIILDEVGRGTSSDDGRALAQSLVEFLAKTIRARTLFATHYHELTHLSEEYASIKNYHFTCTKEGDELRFSHRLASGIALSSFGIDVAKMAGIPDEVILRAWQLLEKNT